MKKRDKGQINKHQVEMYCLILITFLVKLENWHTSFPF